ncbi:MAG: diaminopimelate epimerase [Candidatus Eremiobacteraeota bacterium]|nr:diaminopimelate epimerase [Candidatus Eremiobacteraeota bacterium]
MSRLVRDPRSFDVVKMHGAENAFVLLDERPPRFERYDDLARTLCAPSSEVGGADGILVVRDAPGFAAEMRIFNADGSEAEMCGNGVRCVVRYLAERGAGDSFAIKTLAGPIAAEVVAPAPNFTARVDIGPVTFPRDLEAECIDVAGQNYTFYDVSVGNPHAVVFCDDADTVDLGALGAAFARHPRFPHGTNVHLVRVADEATLEVRHFERGVGLTQACGTGVVAAAAAAIALRGVRSPVTVRVPGGALVVDWARGERARLTGPAETTFARSIDL